MFQRSLKSHCQPLLFHITVVEENCDVVVLPVKEICSWSMLTLSRSKINVDIVTIRIIIFLVIFSIFWAQFPQFHHSKGGDHLISIARISSETASMWLPSVCSVIQTSTSTVSSSPEYKFGILWLENLSDGHITFSSRSPYRSRPWQGRSQFHIPLPPPYHQSCATKIQVYRDGVKNIFT